MPLKVSDGMGTWISDFKKSDAPQFKGKSEKERRDMAIAAYMSAKKEQTEDMNEAAPKPLNRSDHTHTVHIDGEGKYRVKAKSMDHAKKVAFKQAGISKLHGHPTMEPKTRIYGEAVNKDNEKPPFDGPYRKPGQVRKDKYGNVIKNLPRHLARKAARKAAGMKESVNEETNFAVNIEGLPMMFMTAASQGMLKQELRKIVKQPSMIKSVERVTDADVKKTFRLKAQGRDEEQVDEAKLDELSPATMSRYHTAADKSKSRAWAKFDLGKTTAADAHKNQEKRTAGQKLARKKINQKAFRPTKEESQLDELSPSTMNRYKKAAAGDVYKSSSKIARVASTSGLGKRYKDKQIGDAEKRIDKRRRGLDRAARITGTYGQQEEMSHDKDWGLPGSTRHAKKITPGQTNEGTWAVPETPKQKAALKKLMSNPIQLGKEGEGAASKLYSLIGDDELFDDLYVAGKKNPNGDARPVIKKAMKRLRIQ